MRQKTAVINVKVDAATKVNAARLAAKLGIPLSLIVQGSLREFISKRGISFYEDAELKPSPYLIDAIRDARRERVNGKMQGFNSAKEAVAYLRQITKRKKKG